MSGPRDTRETAEPAGTSGVPADPAPPSFGGAAPPADPPPADAAPPAGTPEGDTGGETTDTARSTGTGPLRLPAFGLQAPWWAAESTDTAPPAADPAATGQDAPAPQGTPGTEPASAREPAPATEPAPAAAAEQDAPATQGTPAAEPAATGEATAEGTAREKTPSAAPPGTLVAGTGVPSVDSRRAVPAEPIVKPPVSPDDTDPDGIQAVRPEGAAPEDETAEDEATVENSAVNESAEDGTASPSAFDKAKDTEGAAAQTAVLVPDAILPRGVVPPTGSGPFPHSEAAGGAAAAAPAPVITPVYHAEGGVPLDGPPPPGHPPQGAPGGRGGAGRRRTLLIGGGAAVVLAAAVALFVVGGTDPGSEGQARKAAEPSAAPSPAPASAAPATPKPSGAPLNIANEKTDPEDLTFQDVFPQEALRFGGRTYIRDRWSLNRDVRYAARGSMLRTLEQEKCRKIIRATYIDRKSGLAVTSGIAVMPTKEAATTVSKAGDPARYEWFRGMAGKHSPDIDRAGGYAAATVRGRYVAYAYVQWANGKKARPGDPLIKQVAKRFIDYDLRPVMARARG